MSKIISGFPGIGKSYYKQDANSLRVADSDSGSFSWEKPGIRHPDFPQNYMEHIKVLIPITDLIFVSSHKVVRDALVSNELYFTLVIPDISLKEEYIKRYIDRDNDSKFINFIESNWNSFINEMLTQKGCEIAQLKSGEYLSNYLESL
ncbi:hypothetical protein LCGC14_0305640 [marine sediment metagenome]|uniref:Uncharacterized protein n=1 Tax=marine sediment metagenome TaxID=412755 RepID=A0A0F9TNQ1_9ZZZZ